MIFWKKLFDRWKCFILIFILCLIIWILMKMVFFRDLRVSWYIYIIRIVLCVRIVVIFSNLRVKLMLFCWEILLGILLWLMGFLVCRIFLKLVFWMIRWRSGGSVIWIFMILCWRRMRFWMWLMGYCSIFCVRGFSWRCKVFEGVGFSLVCRLWWGGVFF